MIAKTCVAANAEWNCNGTRRQIQKSLGLGVRLLFLGESGDGVRSFRSGEELNVLNAVNTEDRGGNSTQTERQEIYLQTFKRASYRLLAAFSSISFQIARQVFPQITLWLANFRAAMDIGAWLCSPTQDNAIGMLIVPR